MKYKQIGAKSFMELKEKGEKDSKDAQTHEQQLSDQDAQGININPNMKGVQIATYKSFCKELLRTMNLCLSAFYFGYTLAYLGSFDFSSIIKLYKIEDDIDTVQGLLQGITCIGAGIGALSASVILKMFSRRNSILFINFFAFIFGLFVMQPNLKVFFACRFFQGACVGLYSAIIPLLIKQYAPNQIYGTFGALNQVFIVLGVFFAFAFQYILIHFSSQVDHWKIVYGFTLITTIVQTFLLLFVYKQQTPKYLLLNNREQDCIRYLESVYLPQYVQTVLNQKKSDLNLVKENKNDINIQSSGDISEEVKGSGKKIRIIVAIHLAILQQFVGINAVVAYGVDIITQITPNLAKVIPVVLNFEGVLASLVSSIILAKLGRKIILQAGTLISAISLTMVAFGFMAKPEYDAAGNSLIIVGLIIFMANFNVSLGPVVWLYIAQIVEPEIIPFSTLFNWTAGSIVIITFPILSKAFGTPIPLFFFFAIWSAVSLMANSKMLIETKGKTEKEIRQQYNTK